MMEPSHQYTDVRTNDHHDDDSATEVESLVEGEKSWATDDFHRSHRPRRNILCPPIVAALRWLLVIGLQLIIIGLLARDQGLLDSTKWRARSSSAHEVGGDITGWSPHSE